MQNERMRRIAALLKRIAKDKTYIGRVSKGFDFLGFHCCPTGMAVSEALLLRRDQKIARLYEQGASKERVGAHLRRWLGWARVMVVGLILTMTLYGCAGNTIGVVYDTWGPPIPRYIYCECSKFDFWRSLLRKRGESVVWVDENCMRNMTEAYGDAKVKFLSGKETVGCRYDW